MLAAADAAPSSGSRWWRDEISSENLEWLATLPFQIDFELAGSPVRCFHASADDVFHRVYRNVEGKEWDELFLNNETTGYASPEPELVVYGDIHYAWSRTINGRTLLNCGAVGNPLDEPTASYVLLDDTTGIVHWELIRVPYDIEAELAVAQEVRMPQYRSWEHELRTAEYGGKR